MLVFTRTEGYRHASIPAAVETLRAFAAANGGDADVLIFSPQPDMGALFLNVFEQAETFDPGMIATFEAVLTRLGRPAALAVGAG